MGKRENVLKDGELAPVTTRVAKFTEKVLLYRSLGQELFRKLWQRGLHLSLPESAETGGTISYP